jgi:hypothetical protein
VGSITLKRHSTRTTDKHARIRARRVINLSTQRLIYDSRVKRRPGRRRPVAPGRCCTAALLGSGDCGRRRPVASPGMTRCGTAGVDRLIVPANRIALHCGGPPGWWQRAANRPLRARRRSRLARSFPGDRCEVVARRRRTSAARERGQSRPGVGQPATASLVRPSHWCSGGWPPPLAEVGSTAPASSERREGRAGRLHSSAGLLRTRRPTSRRLAPGALQSAETRETCGRSVAWPVTGAMCGVGRVVRRGRSACREGILSQAQLHAWRGGGDRPCMGAPELVETGRLRERYGAELRGPHASGSVPAGRGQWLEVSAAPTKGLDSRRPADESRVARRRGLKALPGLSSRDALLRQWCLVEAGR